MAYDLELAKRIRALMGDEPNVVEKPMFGGLAFLVNGNMSVSASGKGGLLMRVPPAETMTLAKKPHARPMEMRGRPMEGWLRVDAAGVTTDKALAPWVKIGVEFARTLPAKGGKTTDAKVAKSTSAKSTSAKSTSAKSTSAKSTSAKSTSAKSTSAKSAASKRPATKKPATKKPAAKRR